MLSHLTGNTYKLTVSESNIAMIDVLNGGESIATISIATWIDQGNDDESLLKDTLRIPLKGVDGGYTQIIAW